MLKAELHSKLPDETRVSFERMEDLLTSNLLGSLTYVPPLAGHRQADALVLLQRLEGPPEPILIECKYEMGMSNTAANGGPDGSSTGNQLTDYWRSLDEGAVTSSGGSCTHKRSRRRQGTGGIRQLDYSF